MGDSVGDRNHPPIIDNYTQEDTGEMTKISKNKGSHDEMTLPC